MRDPDRIGPALDELGVFWRKHPDWRLGQVLANAARYKGWTNPDLFYIEDGQLMDGLRLMDEASP